MLTIQASRRQSAVLAAIVQAIRLTGRPPTVREIRAATGISSTSVIAWHIRRLVQAGKIRRLPETARGLWPVTADQRCPVCGGTGRWECEA